MCSNNDVIEPWGQYIIRDGSDLAKTAHQYVSPHSTCQIKISQADFLKPWKTCQIWTSAMMSMRLLNHPLNEQICSLTAYRAYSLSLWILQVAAIRNQHFMGPIFMYLWRAVQFWGLLWGPTNWVIYMSPHGKLFGGGLWSCCEAMARRMFAAGEGSHCLMWNGCLMRTQCSPSRTDLWVNWKSTQPIYCSFLQTLRIHS